MEQTKLTLAQAAALVGKQQNYIRRLILDGKLPATKEVVPNTEVPRWIIDKDTVVEYFASSQGTRRSDGRNKYVLYATTDEFQQVQEALAKVGLSLPLKRANSPEEYARRKAAKAAKTKAIIDSLPRKTTHQTPKPASVPSAAARAAAHALKAEK